LTFAKREYIIKANVTHYVKGVNTMKTLADIRDEKRITQEEMAKNLDISVSTYNMYENGKRKIPSDIVEGICKKLRLSKGKYFMPSTFTVRETKTG